MKSKTFHDVYTIDEVVNRFPEWMNTTTKRYINNLT